MHEHDTDEEAEINEWYMRQTMGDKEHDTMMDDLCQGC